MDKQPRIASFTFELDGEIVTNAEDGWAVVPLVAVKAMKLNGETLALEELERSADYWNGVAMTLPGHPEINGQNVSVNEAPWFSVGRFQEAKVTDGSLRGQAYLPVGHRNDIDAFVNSLQAGGSFDVSTGYFANVIELNGEKYQTDIYPDHIAILLNEDGACSWQDGCGIPRANHNQSCSCQEPETEESIDMQEETTEVQEERQEAPVANDAQDEDVIDFDAILDEALNERLAPLQAQLAELAEAFSAAQEVIANAQAQEAQRRESLVADIVTNSAQWEAGDLDDFSIEKLEKLAATVQRPTNFAGRNAAAVQTNSDEWEPYVKPSLE